MERSNLLNVIILFSILLFSSCSEREKKYKVEDIKVISEKIVEKEYKQTGRRILREQRKRTYTDTIRLYQIILIKDNIKDTLITRNKPYYNIGDSVIY